MTTTTPHPVASLAEASKYVITSYQHGNGAYPASPDFSAYRGYCWFRDGAFIADGISAAGNAESASSFFDWCAATINRNTAPITTVVEAAAKGEPVPQAEMLPARFTIDGNVGDDEWWDFQLDGYGTWLWAAAEHADRHRLDVTGWRLAAELTVDYLISSWDRPCYDWWEEHQDQIHVSTLACIGAGLEAAARSELVTGQRAQDAVATASDIRALIARDGTFNGHLVKWLGSTEVDGSLSAVISPLRFIDPASDIAAATIAAVDEQLSVDGGVHRYLADEFYGGGQWPLLSCFLGLAKAASGDPEGAQVHLDWAAGTATPELLLPEQVDRHLLFPEHQAEWIDRWGTVATPLLWSHAMLLRLDAELRQA